VQLVLTTGAVLQQLRGLVFTTALGRPLDASSVTHRFPKLLAQGVSPRVVMELLGHSHISLTLNTYSHVILALAPERPNVIAAALRPGFSESSREISRFAPLYQHCPI
jgi:hypothetical protein